MERVLEIQRLQNVDRQRLREVPLIPKSPYGKKVKSIFDKELVKKLSQNAIDTKNKQLIEIAFKKASKIELTPREQRLFDNYKQSQLVAYRDSLTKQFNATLSARDNKNFVTKDFTTENLLNEAIWRTRVNEHNQGLHSNVLLNTARNEHELGLKRMFERAQVANGPRYLEKIKAETNTMWSKRFYNRSENQNNLHEFLNDRTHLTNIHNFLSQCIRRYENIKVSCRLKCTFYKAGEGLIPTRYLTGPTDVSFITQLDNEVFEKYVRNMIEVFENEIAAFNTNGTGAILDSIHYLEINVARFRRTRAGKYIDLGSSLKCVINPQNKNDECCFKWCILIDKHWNDVTDNNRDRTSKYKQWENELNFTGIEFPMHIDEIKKFEKQNPEYAVNIFTYNRSDDSRYPRRLASKYWNGEELKKRKIVNLIHIEDVIDGVINTHYAYITDLDKFLGGNIKSKRGCKLDGSRDITHHKRYFCEMCCQGYISPDALNSHKEICRKHEPTRTVLPEPGSSLKFKNINRTMKHDMVVYADLEAVLEKCDSKDPSSAWGNVGSIKQKHNVSAWGMYDTLTKKYRQYTDPRNCLQEFEKELKDLVRTWMKFHTDPTPIIITPEQEAHFRSLKATDVCYMCNQQFGRSKQFRGVDKVRDHCHVTGLYRGPAHYDCNLHCALPTYIPILFHNGSGYDIHHLLRMLVNINDDIIDPKSQNKVQSTMIPISTEKFISFSVKFKINDDGKYIELRFLDSFRFMASSLDRLVEYKNKNLPITKTFFNDKDFQMVTQKGVFPYEWFDSFEKLDYTELPPIEDFTSILSGSISKAKYEHAQIVWKHFNMKTFREYTDLYLQTDVLLLADVFEDFRELCIDTYKLDPVHYYTSANLAWDALLKYSNIELELLSDPDMYLFFEDAIRGGVSQVGSTRYASKKEGENHLMYIDANNLYGYAMLRKLPVRDFKWFEEYEKNVDYILHILRNNNLFEVNKGAVVKVRLIVPPQYHDYYNDFPLAPENRKIKKSEINKWQQEKYGNHNESTTSKLVCSLDDKDNYLVTLENLKFYLEQGLILDKVYTGVWYTQEAWMANYVMNNANLRAQAKTDKNTFKVEFFKLMNNAVFGKTMEDVRKYQEMHIMNVNDEQKILLKTSSDFYKSYKFIDKDLVIISMHKTKVNLCKPIYVGSKVLDLSKLHMYNFFYNCLKRKFEDRVSLIYMDTDSFFLEFKTPDITKEFSREEVDEWFDTGKYPKDHPWYSTKNESVLGKFKDEVEGKIIDEVIAHAPKMYGYSVKTNPGELKEYLKCKGVVQNTVKKFNLDRMKDVLKTGKDSEAAKQYRIASKNHKLYTVEEYKKNCRLMDDKRFILDETVDGHMFARTRALGHWRNQNPV